MYPTKLCSFIGLGQNLFGITRVELCRMGRIIQQLFNFFKEENTVHTHL
jgi:hypothetical protein